ncbi:MAG TPA: choice-of-anchor D domain-containing protein [Kofleriaceae bacterium]|jgi:serine protease|nr:choice-of-anchor D domain-containing protein [Kofleriaceae bacterium]
MLHLAVAGLAASCAGVEPMDEPTSEAARAEIARAAAFTPGDPLYPLQWNYPQIGLPDAWAITRGDPHVRIAIFDSGSTGHPDLDGRFTGGRDFVDGGGPVDKGPWHHGTHVAGILGARTGTSSGEIGGAGICSGCTLIPIRLATPSGELDLGRFAQALHWAVGDLDGGNRQADIVNLSMNLSTTAACPSDTAAAVQYAIDNGVVVVNSAGNFGGAATQPANCPGIISVAATQRDETLAAYTDRGNVTLAAPGGSGTLAEAGGDGAGVGCTASDSTFGHDDGVLSTWAVYPIVSPLPGDYCYRYLSGTSMAAPHVSGTVGLVLSAARSAGVTFTPAQITRLLTLTAQPIACAHTTCGAGLVDARAAVTAASHGGLPRLTVTPPSFAFDPVLVGASSPVLTVVATSTGVGPVTIPSFELTGTGAAQFQIDFPGCAQSCTGPFTIPQDTAIGFRVACRPTAAGAWSASLVFHNNSDTGDVAIPLSCTATAPRLVLDTASIDFGVAHLGTPAPTRPVHVTNPGNAPLTFQVAFAAPFSAACTFGCTCTGSTCSGTVPPAGTAALAVGYTPSALGLQSSTLTVTSDDPFHPTVPIHVRGTGGIGTGSLAALALGDVQVGSAAAGSLTLTNTGSYTLTVTAIDLTDAADFELAYTSGPCAGATHCTVAQQAVTTLAIPVRCHPAARGALSSQITLSTDGAPAQVTAQLTCNGVTPHLALGAESLAFGDVAVGATASADVFIANTTPGTQLSFSASQGSSQYALGCVAGCTCADDICTGTVGATPATLRVTFAPTQVGAQAANLTLVTNDPDAPLTTGQATGTGIGPVFQRVAPTSGALSFVAVGRTSAPRIVTIGNAGNAPLHITGAPFSGAAASALQITAPGGLPVTVAPGATVDFSVTCTPTWNGQVRTAQLTFTADASPTTTIDITCSTRIAQPPNPNPDPPPVDR